MTELAGPNELPAPQARGRFVGKIDRRATLSFARAMLIWALPPLVVTLFAWTPQALLPAPGLDQGWVAGLQMAVHDGLPFGTRAVFTYGPLGFLWAQPEVFQFHLAEFSFVYAIVLRFAVAAAIYHRGAMSFGRVGAFVLALVAVSVAGVAELSELVVGVIVAMWALDRGLRDRHATALLTGLAAFAAFELLVKLSLGISLGVLTAILAFTLPGLRWRRCLVTAGVFVLALLLFWLVAGQPLGSLATYLREGAAVTSGYTDAMNEEASGLGWEYTAALLALAFGLWGALQQTAGSTLRRQIGMLLLWLAFWFEAFKEGFVRHDIGHSQYFAGGVLLGLFAIRWVRQNRGTGLVGVAALIVFVLACQANTFSSDVRPFNSANAFFTEVGDFFSSSTKARLQASGRAAIENAERLDPTTLAQLAGNTVAIYPTDQEIAWAYQLDWDPIPVLQAYSAYTGSLDGEDASFLTSADSPRRILVQGGPEIDGRVPQFDEPQTLRTMFCRYQPVHEIAPDPANQSAGFLVLAKATSRCIGRPRLIQTMRTGWGDTVQVPSPPRGGRWMVFARIDGAAPTGFEKLSSTLYKSAQRSISINGASPNRLIAGTADDGLPLAITPGADWPSPFNVAVGAKTILLLDGAGAQPTGSGLTVTFYAQRLS